MKIMVCTALVFVAFLTFVPRTGTSDIRNLPLLIALLLLGAFYLIYRFVRLLYLMHSTKKALRRVGARIKKSRFLYAQGYVLAEKNGEELALFFLIRKRSWYHYHFRDPRHLEFFKTTRATVVRKYGKFIQGSKEMKAIGRQKLLFMPEVKNCAPCRYFVIIDRFPRAVSDSVRHECLGNGDSVCDSALVLYDRKGFLCATANPE